MSITMYVMAASISTVEITSVIVVVVIYFVVTTIPVIFLSIYFLIYFNLSHNFPRRLIIALYIASPRIIHPVY